MNWPLFSGALLGLISVIMGALGDHIFDLTPDQIETLNTAIRYNMLYAVLITGIALTRFADIPEKTSKNLQASGAVFVLGTVLFSFGIYASIITELPALTYLTPIGGITIMAGWSCLIWVAVKNTLKGEQ